MKTRNDSITRIMRVLRLGSALIVMVLAASAVEAQYTGPTPQQTPVPGNPAAISHAAREFLQFAAQANQAEIIMANVAETRSENSTVRELARMMLTDHHDNYNLLQVTAQNHWVVLDSKLDWMNKRAVNHLDQVNAADFDRAYTAVVMKDHVKCIAKFDKAVTEMEEPSIREYAQNTLPILRKHLRHAEDAARSVGVDEATISSILRGLPGEEAQRTITFNQN
jgi:putative membrane protein